MPRETTKCGVRGNANPERMLNLSLDGLFALVRCEKQVGASDGSNGHLHCGGRLGPGPERAGCCITSGGKL